MKINVKLTGVFLLVALLVGFVGYKGITSIKYIQENNNIESNERDLAGLMEHSLLLTLQLTRTENLDDYSRVKSNIEDTGKEFDILLNKENKEVRNRFIKDFGSFNDNVSKYTAISNGIISVHKEKLELNLGYSENSKLEYKLRVNGISPLYALNSTELTAGIISAENLRREALYQFKDEQHVNKWLDSIQEVENEVKQLDLPEDQKNNFLQNIGSYQFTAQRLGEIVIKQKNVETEEALRFEQLAGIIEKFQENKDQIVNRIHAENSLLAENTHITMLIVIMAVFFGAVSLGFLIDRSVLKPVLSLRDAADKIAKGNFDTRIKITSRDEIGELGLAFNKMAQDLQKTRNDIISAESLQADIAERNKAQEALRESEERYRRLVEVSPFGIAIHSDYKIVYANLAAMKILGAVNPEELVGRPMLQIIHPDYHEIFKERIRKQNQGEIAPLIEEKFLKLDGTTIDIEIISVPIVYKGKQAMYGIFQDIAERKIAGRELRESEEKYRSLIDNIQDGVFIIQDAKVQFANEASARISGYTVEEIIGMDFRDHIAPEDQEMVANNYQRRQAGENVPEEYEFRFMRKDGTRAFVNMNVGLITYRGRVASMGTVKDITERRQAEEKIKASLREKEVLLSEIHHRVKNNMQIIASLLRLQSNHIMEEKYREMLKESQNRIKSMSLVHEKLYNSKDLAKIDFRNYIRDLAKGLLQSYTIDKSNIALNINVENISLGIDSAIPCGLIINELVTNSLKYAFPDGRQGEIEISLCMASENMIELTVGDNGVGISRDVDFRNTKSLGLQLVAILANQLHAEINLNRDNGTQFEIKFKEVE